MAVIPASDRFAARRAAYLRALGEDAALIFGSVHAVRNADSEYRYRPSSDLYYLTGWEEPDAVALFRPGAELPFILFVLPRDRVREVWTGTRVGVEGARALHGADSAFPIHELPARLPELLQGYATLHYAWGDPDRDRLVFGALRGARRAASRNGLEMPHQLVDGGRVVAELRLRKTADELVTLREAAAITAEAHVAAMRLGRPGVHEYELEAAIDGAFRRRGGEGPGYTTIVGGGANACILHYINNRDALRDGELCLVDAGCEYRYYTADVTRTWPVNGRFSGPQRDLYQVVLDAQLAAIDAARPGRPFKDMHDVAVRGLVTGMIALELLHGDVDTNIADESYRRYYMHGTGHWLGLDVHDAGAYWEGLRSRLLEPDMVLTVEPGLYVQPDDDTAPAHFRGIGIRIEDDIRVTHGDPENLTAACPKTVDALESVCAR